MTSRGRTGIAGALAVAIVGFGLLAEWAANGPAALRPDHHSYPWVLDLLTGLAMMACGTVTTARRPSSLVGPLMLAAAVAWFVATLVDAPAASRWPQATALGFLYWGFLAHALIAFPSGRPGGRLELGAVIVGYLAALLPWLWRGPLTGVTLLLMLATVTWIGMRRAHGRSRATRAVAVRVAGLFAAAGIVRAAAYLSAASYPWGEAVTIGLHLALVTGVLALAMGLLRSDRAAVGDLVAGLGEMPATTLSAVLASMLGAPTFRVGLRSAAGDLRDELGAPVGRPLPGGTLAAIDVLQEDRPIAVIIAPAGTLDDPDLRRAVVDAVRMAAANHELRMRVAARVGDLEASRRRLIVAADEAGERLAQRVHDGALHHLAGVASELRAASTGQGLAGGPGGGSAGALRLAALLGRVEQAADDLRAVAHGLAPRRVAEAGLGEALRALAAESPVPVDLDIRVAGLPPELARDAYLVAAEALANVAKHASAGRAGLIAVAEGGRLRLVVDDDGLGGARLENGTGLRGLADRAASLAGTLRLESPPGRGTILRVDWPLPQAAGPEDDGGIVETRSITAGDTTGIPDGMPAAAF